MPLTPLYRDRFHGDGYGARQCDRAVKFTCVLVAWFPLAVQNSDNGSLEVHKPDWFEEECLHPARQCLSLRMVIPYFRLQDDRTGGGEGSDGSHIVESASGDAKVCQDKVRR